MRLVLDILIVLSRHPLLSMGLVAIAWMFTRERTHHLVNDGRGERVWRRMRPALVGLSALILAAFLADCLWYLQHAGYTSDVEAAVASISWWLRTGGELYHDPEAATQYSLLYGPSVFLLTGFYMDLLGPSVMASKAGPLLALFLSLALLILTLRRWVSSRLAFGMTVVAVLLYWICGSSAMLVRPDPYLLAAVGFALYSVGSPRRTLAIAGAGLGLGLAVNLKLHALMYMLPVLALMDEQHGWRATLAALGLGGVLILLPFFSEAISLRHYLEWIFVTAHHGLDYHGLPHMLSRAIFYAMPALVPLSAGRGACERAGVRPILVKAWAVGNLVVVMLALKPGAGEVHLLPLIPLNLVFAARLWPQEGTLRLMLPDRRASWRLGLVASFLFVALFSGMVGGYRSSRLASYLMTDADRITEDVLRIQTTYPDKRICMGYGGFQPYFHWTNQRTLLIMSGQPLLLDISALMDSRRAHKPIPRGTYDLIANGAADLWLIPKGKTPFEITNWYPPHAQVFPEDFRELFLRAYRRVGSTEFFDLWAYAPTTGLDVIRLDPTD